MLKQLHDKRVQAPSRCFLPGSSTGQAVMGEYTLVIFLVIAVITAMTVFFKRLVQARLHDARDYMINEVRERTRGKFVGNLYREYEPYYVDTTAVIARDVKVDKSLSAGGTSGVFTMDINETTEVRDAVSVTRPPSEHERTTPKK